MPLNADFKIICVLPNQAKKIIKLKTLFISLAAIFKKFFPGIDPKTWYISYNPDFSTGIPIRDNFTPQICDLFERIPKEHSLTFYIRQKTPAEIYVQQQDDLLGYDIPYVEKRTPEYYEFPRAKRAKTDHPVATNPTHLRTSGVPRFFRSERFPITHSTSEEQRPPKTPTSGRMNEVD